MPLACHHIRADQILTAASGRCLDYSVIYLRSFGYLFTILQKYDVLMYEE